MNPTPIARPYGMPIQKQRKEDSECGAIPEMVGKAGEIRKSRGTERKTIKQQDSHQLWQIAGHIPEAETRIPDRLQCERRRRSRNCTANQGLRNSIPMF
jgi:hypothetical protein